MATAVAKTKGAPTARVSQRERQTRRTRPHSSHASPVAPNVAAKASVAVGARVRAFGQSLASTNVQGSKRKRAGNALNKAVRKLLKVFAAGGSGGGSKTKKGTRRSKIRTSGFRARNATPGGKAVLRRRRKKGRKQLAPQAPTYANGAKRW